jgi:2-amino-4-hydroxy-6-hydroxymethyldihydropteridine diphosphokinase
MAQETPTEALIALGANLPSTWGGPLATLRRAIDVLPIPGITVKRVSGFYQTPAFPPGAGPDYVNAAAVLATSLPPFRVLERLHEVEASFGREREVRWGQRTLDLDLLAFGDLVLPDNQTHQHWRLLPAEAQIRNTPDQLILPHPRLQDRAFVLVPLADVAPDWVHPVLRRSVGAMCSDLPSEMSKEVRPIGDSGQ